MPTPGGDATTFHLVCHGEAWVHLPNHAEPIALRSGDIAFFPHDAAHAISGLLQVPRGHGFSLGKPVAFDENAPGTGFCAAT